MPTVRLTDLTVRALLMGTHFDATTPAFGIRVGKHRRTWIVMRGQERRRIRIGHYPALTLSEARKEAKRLLAATHLPGKRVTFGEAYEVFKTDYITRRKARTQKDYRRMIETHFLPTLKPKRMDAISSYTLSAITDGLADTPSEQAHALSVCRIFFRWAIRPPRQYITVNPLEGVQIAKSKKRKRILSDEELRAVWAATGQVEGVFGEIVRLLILMGQRRGETAALRDTYYGHNAQILCLPGEITKNGRDHAFAVGPMAAEIMARNIRKDRPSTLLFQAVGSENPFSGWSKCKKALDKVAKIAPWTLHDLRRTFRTNLGRLRVRPDIAERLVNHISARTEMEETYDLYTYLPEMREAMEKWEAFVQSACITASVSRAA
jgi:integrase